MSARCYEVMIDGSPVTLRAERPPSQADIDTLAEIVRQVKADDLKIDEVGIRRRRFAKDMSLRELAREVGVSAAQMSRYENGEAAIPADVAGWLDTLLGGER